MKVVRRLSLPKGRLVPAVRGMIAQVAFGLADGSRTVRGCSPLTIDP